MVRFLVFMSIFLLGFVLTAWASIGLPHQELSFSEKAQPKQKKKDTPTSIKKPQRIDRAGIYTMDALMDLNIAPPRGQKVFNSNEISFDTPSAYVGKIEALQRFLEKSRVAFEQTIILSDDSQNESLFNQWQVFLKKTTYLSQKAQIEAVQAFVNRTPYHHDSDSTRSGDTWKDPEDFLTFGGDSEDFALVKYISLRLLGISPERLRIAIVFDQEKSIYRAVTLVYANTDVLVLDETKNDISVSRDMPHLVPVYSFNEKHIWYHWKKDGRPPAQFLQTDMQKQYPVFP
jgi:predicted transglutaminase-like cysteine proteinase